MWLPAPFLESPASDLCGGAGPEHVNGRVGEVP